MALPTLEDMKRVEWTLLAVRTVVACAAAGYVLVASARLDAAGTWVPAAAAAGLLLGCVATTSVALRLVASWRGLRRLATTTFVVDAVLLAMLCGASLRTSDGSGLAWMLLAWLPLAAALRFGTPGVLLAGSATAALAGLVAASLALTPQVALGWATLGVPMLAIVVATAIAVAWKQLHRQQALRALVALRDERQRSHQLVEADELKNTFLAAVSHELRTPLTSILGFAVTLHDRPDVAPEQRERMLRTMIAEAEHLEDILANLLDLDRLTRGKAALIPSEVDIARLVSASVRLVELRSGRTIGLDVEPGLVARLDAAKVERILENLVGNAVKYTPDDASVEVRVARRGSGIDIRVDDDGPGIACELRDGIFEAFRRGTDVGVPGTGIGLSLVDRFSRMHGGRAWVEERPGGGCRFMVHLPQVGTDEGPATRHQPAGDGAEPHPATEARRAIIAAAASAMHVAPEPAHPGLGSQPSD